MWARASIDSSLLYQPIKGDLVCVISITQMIAAVYILNLFYFKDTQVDEIIVIIDIFRFLSLGSQSKNISIVRFGLSFGPERPNRFAVVVT